MANRLLSYAELRRRKGVSYSKRHLLRLESAGRFPKRVRLSDRVVAWHEREVDQYLAALAAAKRESPVPDQFTEKKQCSSGS